MRVVVQRVSEASVAVAGDVIASIGHGLLVLVGFRVDDDETRVDWMADRVGGLRVFPDDAGKMNRSVADVDGALLVVSQFTLYGDATKGRRPSFVEAAPPAQAEPLYRHFVTKLRDQGLPVAEGAFGAMMAVSLVNDGPVTIVLDR